MANLRILLENVKMSISKVRFLTDTLMTGEKIHKMYGMNPSCLCGHPMENRFHILLDCKIYNDLRNFCIQEITKVIKSQYPKIQTETIQNRTVVAHLILDPTWYRNDIGSSTKIMPNILSIHESNKIEIIGRAFCFQVYKRRFAKLSVIDSIDSEDETDCSDSYSLHDTSSESSISNCSYLS